MHGWRRNSAIIRLRREGVGPREIARRLGESPSAVAGVLHRAGLCSEKRGRGFGLQPSVIDAMRAERAAGVGYRTVAKHFGVNERAAHFHTRGARA